MIIILGATGTIGQRIMQQLTPHHSDIWQPSRQWLATFQQEKNDGALHQALQLKITEKTIVINAIGIAPGLTEHQHRSTYLTQKSIIDFCMQQNIAKIISLSALSHHPTPSSIPYLNYKYRLDNELLNSLITSYIVRPSLVYAKNGASTIFFKLLTRSPVLALPNNPNYVVSPIDVDELAQFILALTQCNLPSQVFEVGTTAITLPNYLKKFNPTLIIIPLPEWLMRCTMTILGMFLPALAGKYTYELLKAGSTNQRDDFCKIMGHTATIPPINSSNQSKDNDHD